MTTASKALHVKHRDVWRFSGHSQDLLHGPVEMKFPRRMTEEELAAFSADNSHLRIEQEKNGKLQIMPPIDFDSGVLEGRAYGYLFAWWLTYQQGEVCSPSTGFVLPDSSMRASDGSWIFPEKVAALTVGERKRFAHVVPDFVMEVRSTSDRLSKLKKKMADTWIKNGVRLAWLIDPVEEKAYVYYSDGQIEVYDGFSQVLSGGEICPGLEVDLAKLKR